jgi:hypothetical protein
VRCAAAPRGGESPAVVKESRDEEKEAGLGLAKHGWDEE